MNFEEHFEKLDIPLHGVRLPEYQIPDSLRKKYGLDKNTSNFDCLRSLMKAGFIQKIKHAKHTEEFNTYAERAKRELDLIKDLGFVDYFLLVWDVINFCRENDIATGFGRGSCAGSLILYLIDVTRVDPIKYDLYFERFISKTRAKKNIVDGITYLDGSLMPDVDLDISYSDRHRVVEYVRNKYAGKTCKILTTSTLSGKILMKECGKVVGGKTDHEMCMVSDMIPKVYGIVKDIESAYTEVKLFKQWCDENKETYQVALKLRDLIKNKGCHPSGYAVTYYPISETCPVELSADKEIVSGYDMEWMGQLSVKLDLLGLRSASLVHETCKLIGITPESIDLNDKIIYDNLQNLQTPHGIFQIEAETNFKVTGKVKPKNLEQLSAVLAIARPGALDFVDQYAKYSNEGESCSVHPFLDKVFGKTGGVPLYQEQLMAAAVEIGFTLEEAEILRRIVGKKKVDEVKMWHQKITDKVKENGIPEEAGEVLWKVLNDSANYSFNKSHSQAYASLSAATVYLKFKYPQQFFLSLLKLSRFEPDQITEISTINKELRFFGIRLLPPSLAKSSLDFKIEGKDIRFGLLSVKGIADKAIEKIEQFRKEYATKFDMFEASRQAKLSIGILSALIQAGAFSDFSDRRSRTVLEAQLWTILKDKEKSHAFSLGEKYKYDLFEIMRFMKTAKDASGKPMIREKRYETIKKWIAPYKKIYELNSKCESFANWWYENKLLGFTYDQRLMDIFKADCPDLMTIEEVNNLDDKERAIFVGKVEEVVSGIAKNEKKTRYLKCIVSDETGKITAMLFNDKIELHLEDNAKKVVEGNIVVVKGRRFGDAVFADFINIQDHKIYMKLADLKNDNKESKED